MSIARRNLLLGALGVLPGLPAVSFAQADKPWPNRSLRFITPYPPGGSSDLITRFVAERVSRTLGQPVVVENKPGAAAALGTEYAARATPDGYTFFVGPTATVAIAPWLRKVGYGPESFIPVARLSSSYGLVTARKDAPFGNYKEFVAAAKAHPGRLTFGTNGVGSIVHLIAVLLHKQAGIEVTHVPYKGAIETIGDLIGGRIDVMYDPASLPRVKAGDLKGLGTIGTERNPQLPDLPTLPEQGFDVDVPSWFGLFAPIGTPAPVVASLAEQVRKVLAEPGVREQLLVSSMYPDYEGPAEFGKRVPADAAFFRDLVRREGIKAE
jgi:tripartite-type tricarboxylate transporter receptor subunit TctC